MYERFTDRARKVMQMAIDEAKRFHHEYIGTEHILLGLVREGSGVATRVLKNLNIDLHKVRFEIEKIVQPGPDTIIPWKPPLTPRAKRVIEYAKDEAKKLKHNYVDTEHLLLGLTCEDMGVAPQILMNLGLNLPDVREEVLQVLGHTKATADCERCRQMRAMNQLSQNTDMKVDTSESKGNLDPSANNERIRSLEQQLWNVRVMLGALVGAIAGALLLAQFGAIMGLLVGGLVAAIAWRPLGILAGGIMGAFLGSTHLPNDGGPLIGVLLGALAGFLIAEIGGLSSHRRPSGSK